MNLVEITVRSDASQANRAIDEIKTKLTDLGTKVAEAKIRLAGNDTALIQLERLKLRMNELSATIADPHIDLKGIAKAQAELLMLLATMDRLGKIDTASGGGFKFTFGQGSSGFFGAIQKGLAAILNLGPAATPILGGIALAIAAIITYLGSLITELAAAGIGIAAFGALALPTFMKIVSGIQGVSAAADKLSTDKMVKGITAAQIAADKLAQAKAWAAIPVALQPAVRAGLALKDAFDQAVQALQPTAVRVFGDALKVIRDLLPNLLPIANSVGKAIDGLLKQFDGFVKSAGFKAFMSQMDALAGPAVTAIGKGLGQVAIAIGNLITAGSGPQGLALLAGTFKTLADAINAVAWSVKTSQHLIFSFMSGIAGAVGPLVDTAKRITDAFLTMVSTIARAASKVPGLGFFKGIADAADRAKVSADNSFAGIVAGAQAMRTRISNMPIIYHLQGDITDLSNKVAASKALLKTVPKSQTSAIRADISQAESQIAAIRAALAAINGTTATTYVQTIAVGGLPKATGGITGAAGGGGRSGMTLVGEHGAELVSLPPGSMVHSNPDTQRMLSQGGGGIEVTLTADPRISHELDRALLKWIKLKVRTTGGGDVQAAFGSG